MKIQQQQKPPRGFSQAKCHRWEFLTFDFKKMITEMLLVLPLYLILFFIWWRFRPLIKAMADAGDIFDDDFLGDVVDTPKEGTEQHGKRECLKSLIDSGRLGHKWTHKRVDKSSDEVINKTYTEYKQRELNEKGEKTAKVLGKDVINLYSKGISQFVKIRDVKKLRQEIKDDPLIKDQMVNVGCLLVYTLGDYLAPVLVVVHALNNLDRGD